MLASELINDLVPALKLSDTISQALVWMDEFRCKHLPVVHRGSFLGLVSEETILAQQNVTQIKDLPLACSHCKVTSDTHFFEIIKMVSGNDIDLIGVVDAREEYLGVITIKDAIYALAQTFAVQSSGAVLVLSMKAIDYSLAEIGRLAETEGYKVLSSSIKKDRANPDKIKLTLKVDSENIERLVATLERFNYKVIGRFQAAESTEDDKERLDEFFKYLDL